MVTNSQSLVDTYYIIAPERFHFLKFIIEGYDNLGVVSSVSGRHGIVRLKCSRESLPELVMLMADIAGVIKRPCW
ncbi:MAG: DUF4911 domain-containing protein [Desulfofustis sp.]|jgi:hypothetical protein